MRARARKDFQCDPIAIGCVWSKYTAHAAFYLVQRTVVCTTVTISGPLHFTCHGSSSHGNPFQRRRENVMFAFVHQSAKMQKHCTVFSQQHCHGYENGKTHTHRKLACSATTSLFQVDLPSSAAEAHCLVFLSPSVRVVLCLLLVEVDRAQREHRQRTFGLVEQKLCKK